MFNIWYCFFFITAFNRGWHLGVVYTQITCGQIFTLLMLVFCFFVRQEKLQFSKNSLDCASYYLECFIVLILILNGYRCSRCINNLTFWRYFRFVRHLTKMNIHFGPNLVLKNVRWMSCAVWAFPWALFMKKDNMG